MRTGNGTGRVVSTFRTHMRQGETLLAAETNAGTRTHARERRYITFVRMCECDIRVPINTPHIARARARARHFGMRARILLEVDHK